MSAPEVSIILPVFNAGPDFTASLDRLERTVIPGAEVIVVDDGSTDGTANRVLEYAAARPYVRAILLKSNAGVANARNTALRDAKGEYVWFVDWDDEWSEDIVRIMLSRARETAADAVVCRSTWRLDSGQDVAFPERVNRRTTEQEAGAAFDLLLRGSIKGYLWSKLLRRELLPHDMFPPQRSQSDLCGLAPVLAAVRTLTLEPQVLYHHVTREGSITRTRNPDLENLNRCFHAVQTAAHRLPLDLQRERLLLHYEYAFVHLSRINTALRWSSADVAANELAGASRAMRSGEIVQIASVSPRVALDAAAVKLLGQRYVIFDRFVVKVRRARRYIRGSLTRTVRTAARANSGN